MNGYNTPALRLLIWTTPKGLTRDKLVSAADLGTELRKLQARGCRNICCL
jgi:hypothetical protein